jgi:hypothetical protein
MLVSQFGMIFVEDLNVKGLAGGMLAKAVHDASWSRRVSTTLRQLLTKFSEFFVC